jgi:hypothetical protein
MKKMTVLMKNGEKVSGDYFDKRDLKFFIDIFKDWVSINNSLTRLGGRSINVPDVFSEAIYCIFFEAIRTNGTGYSYDCVDIKTGEGIQVKSSSIEYDLTSFGPTSTWDKLIFADFSSNGKVDGIVRFYLIDEDIYSIVMNQGKNETFLDQQRQGRRPRFSIKRGIITPNNKKPILEINLLEGSVINEK